MIIQSNGYSHAGALHSAFGPIHKCVLVMERMLHNDLVLRESKENDSWILWKSRVHSSHAVCIKLAPTFRNDRRLLGIKAPPHV